MSLVDKPRAIDLYCPLCGPVEIAVVVGNRYTIRTEVWLESCRIVVGGDLFESEVHTCGAFDPAHPPPWLAEPEMQATTICALCSCQLDECEHFVAGHIHADYIEGAMVSICDQCIAASHDALAEPGIGVSIIPLPSRFVGRIPSPTACAEIVATLRTAFADHDVDQITRSVVNGQRFRDPLQRLKELQQGTEPSRGVRVNLVRFMGAGRAEVHFSELANGGTVASHRGEVVHIGGRWLVSDDCFIRVTHIHPPL